MHTSLSLWNKTHGIFKYQIKSGKDVSYTSVLDVGWVMRSTMILLRVLLNKVYQILYWNSILADDEI